MGAEDRLALFDENVRELKDRATAATARCAAQAKARAELRRQRGLEPFVVLPEPVEQRRTPAACRKWRQA